MPNYSPSKILTEKPDLNDVRRKMERGKLVNLVVQEASNLKQVTDELQSYIANRKTIPSKLIDHLVRSTKNTSAKIAHHISDSSTLPKPAAFNDSRRVSDISSSESQLIRTKQLPPLNRNDNNNSNESILSIFNNPPKPNGRREDDNLPNKSYSKMKWTDEERSRMKQIYHEMAQPTQKNNVNLWVLYLESFASRYRAFFPSRSEKEVIEKVREMIAFRKLKEPGEPEFWKQVMSGLSIEKT